MKIILASTALLLTAFSADSYSNEEKTIHGIIHFVGSISRAPCEYPTATWHQHAGRTNSSSPDRAGAVPAPSNRCAGISDTSSISTYEVAGTSRTTTRGKVVVVTFN
ncbi:hypothetical protein [Pseudomonas sp. TCU-HL1]|uniref:hypothetical protein n=1 Tax=Pseudomonas sp. TCU-HL1 TaxID=1856685 RepID=UPI000857644A|nr:hypothetical protein [Pseudomonas sp. TCU-HL1]AOE82921.1 hypothetical protein THL1_373 [Pseudomonas sp. TCU-HL1]